MSESFIQVTIPCKNCLVAAACQDKKKLNDDIYDSMLAISKFDLSKKIYRKGLIECWANLGWNIISNMRDTEVKNKTKESIPEFMDLLIELTALLQWMVNSTSWKKGQKFGFDKTEITRRLEAAIGYIKNETSAN